MRPKTRHRLICEMRALEHRRRQLARTLAALELCLRSLERQQQRARSARRSMGQGGHRPLPN